MKKIITLVLGSLLLLGATACTENSNTTAKDGEGVRSNQIESDARARDQRERTNSATGSDQQTTGDLAVDVRNSLESKLPGSRLAVDVDDGNGMATIDGTVVSQKQFDEIKPLVMAFDGIKSVNVKAEVKPN
jgi:osmotically-inducible protein OsmY